MKGLFDLALEVQKFLREREWKFCFIGGLALQRWGENRLTRDIDITLLSGFGNEISYIDLLLARYAPRRADAKQFALEYRVLLLQSENNIGIDISLGALPFEEDLIERATDFEFLPGIIVCTCSAEDLVVLKAFASRPQDWVDVRGILVRQGKALDRRAVVERLEPLVALKEEPEILEHLHRLYLEIAD